jgi:hypothetical protein
MPDEYDTEDDDIDRISRENDAEGYECTCGYSPTARELQLGNCPHCRGWTLEEDHEVLWR